MITFKATIHRIQIDKEGEGRVTITLPLTARNELLKMGEWTEKVIDFTAKLESEEKVKF